MHQSNIFATMAYLLDQYTHLLKWMDARWDKYPSGTLSTKRHEQSLYHRYNTIVGDSYSQISIPTTTKSGAKLVQDLIEKRTVYHARPILRKNIKALKEALAQLEPYEPELLTGFLSSGEQRAPKEAPTLSDKLFLPGQLNVQKWIEDTLAGNFQLNPYKREKCIIPTAYGHLTRSKSEEKWCDILAAESLLYRYDSGLRLASGRTVYPDFMVLHPRERRLVLIEHFGLMDSPGYAIDQLYKLEEYTESGYLPGRDMFFTVETKDRPLTRDRIYEVLYRSGLLRVPA